MRARVYRQPASPGSFGVVAGKAAARGSTADVHHDPATAHSQSESARTGSPGTIGPSCPGCHPNEATACA